jgi:hypothetical protein
MNMHPFTERLAARIENPQPKNIAETLIDAGEMLRMWRFFGGDPSGSAVVGPFSEATEYPWVHADDAERLKQALVGFVRQHPHHPQLGSAVHALYYLAAPETKDLLVEVLRDCLGRDAGALYQTILALEELGENLYGTPTDSSVVETEHHEHVARAYLSSRSQASSAAAPPPHPIGGAPK